MTSEAHNVNTAHATTPGRVAKGRRYRWMGKDLRILRVARDGTWCDVRVTQADGATWTRRQPLPLPHEAEPAQAASGLSATEQRWHLDFASTAEAIPESWLVRDGEWTGIDSVHADKPVVRLYRNLMVVGYARGWLR